MVILKMMGLARKIAVANRTATHALAALENAIKTACLIKSSSFAGWLNAAPSVLRVRAIIAILLASFLALPAQAADVQLVEQQIKAGLLYNFLKYTQWPPESAQREGTTKVCLFGGDPFDGHLQPMAGRTVNEHVIEVRSVRAVTDIDDCSLLFVRADQKANWPELQKALAGKSVLTVSDFEGFALSGGMIEFTRIANRISVTINTEPIGSAKLQVEDRLLRLASMVRTTTPGP
ncbi:MAG TPA: YfiR family protein [Micropepsaceae bacterium]|jgi:hypothetical protein